MIRGKIIKGIAGFYYVYTPRGLVECKAKGIFRKENIKPLVGDNVEISIVDEGLLQGNIVRILPRENELIRPASANIDQALVIFAITRPSPNYNLLDRFLITMGQQGLPAILCFNKQDLATEEEGRFLEEAYRGSGHPLLFVSGQSRQGIEEIRSHLLGRTTVVAGPSGVGKSTIVNGLFPKANMETGEISQKTLRGKHTTRHAQLFALSEDTFIMDTPGFTSLNLGEMEKEELKSFYPEFAGHGQRCRFGSGCIHISEPSCGVKEALEEGKISKVRYGNYVMLFDELKNRKKY
ncbi:small ribosomal subunit biogenesis GTPase RsgA [Lachnospiraceae bacterium]|nr:small ribosomal subunit biogenesis GTPase RsgA [Lachnospiraceae bacterium]